MPYMVQAIPATVLNRRPFSLCEKKFGLQFFVLRILAISRVARTVKIAFCWAHELEKV